MTNMPDVAIDGAGGGIDRQRIKDIFAEVSASTNDGLLWWTAADRAEHPDWGNSTLAFGKTLGDEITKRVTDQNDAIDGLSELALDGFTEDEIRGFVRDNFASPEAGLKEQAIDVAAGSVEHELGMDDEPTMGRIVGAKEHATLDRLGDRLVEALVDTPSNREAVQVGEARTDAGTELTPEPEPPAQNAPASESDDKS